MGVPVIIAVCTFYGALRGDIYLKQYPDCVKVEGVISGIKTHGKHGFHVHENPFVNNNCTTAGAHYNPFKDFHGSPTSTVRHAGDLGNIQSGSSGQAIINIWDPIIQLSGPFNIIGRSLVVHEKMDDLGRGQNEESLKTGNAGSRLDCCIIKTTQSTPYFKGNNQGVTERKRVCEE